MDRYVDCSSHNGTPDLGAYWAAGHRALMFKATEGTGYAWSAMPGLAAEWHAMGGRAGYYHWLYATEGARAQHDFFWSHVAPVFRPGDWLMTDFEDVEPARWRDDATHLAVLNDFNHRCAAHAEVHTYTGNWYLHDLPLCAAYLRSQLVVMSDYSHPAPGNPYSLTYSAHQFTDRAVVAGFPRPVDYNRWLRQPAPVAAARPQATNGSTATHLEEEIDMLIIHPVGRPAMPALSNGVAATRIQDGATVAALRAAGVKVVAFSERDYASQLNAGRK